MVFDQEVYYVCESSNNVENIFKASLVLPDPILRVVLLLVNLKLISTTPRIRDGSGNMRLFQLRLPQWLHAAS